VRCTPASRACSARYSEHEEITNLPSAKRDL
jgi:hypothetical protein